MTVKCLPAKALAQYLETAEQCLSVDAPLSPSGVIIPRGNLRGEGGGLTRDVKVVGERARARTHLDRQKIRYPGMDEVESTRNPRW